MGAAANQFARASNRLTHRVTPLRLTGNFVTLGAALVHGSSGIVAKLLALPVFCVVILLARLLHYYLGRKGWPVLQTMLTLKLVLLALAATLAITLGPFPNGDAWAAIVTGMILVSAMAIQNAVHRVHLASAPPTTLMTGTTTQIMIDIADLLHGVDPEVHEATRTRLRRMAFAVLSFAVGAGLAALAFTMLGMWCFLFPVAVGLLARTISQNSQAQLLA